MEKKECLIRHFPIDIKFLNSSDNDELKYEIYKEVFLL